MLLSRNGLVGAMIDISDGLAADLHHLCAASRVGATIEASQLPIEEDVRQWCTAHDFDPLAFALGGGEDYVLLFTMKSGMSISGELHDQLRERGEALYRIGRTESGNRINLLQDGLPKLLPPDGFDHFRHRSN